MFYENPFGSDSSVDFGENMQVKPHTKAKAPITSSNLESLTSNPSVAPIQIKGTTIPMNYSLMGWNAEHPNPLATKGITSTFEAMRGHGRTHTSRNYSLLKRHGLQEGDYAKVYDKNSNRAMIVKINREYPITPQMIADPYYLAKWEDMEKHHRSLLQDKKYKYGISFEPIGDWINGKIVPFE